MGHYSHEHTRTWAAKTVTQQFRSVGGFLRNPVDAALHKKGVWNLAIGVRHTIAHCYEGSRHLFCAKLVDAAFGPRWRDR